MSRIPPQDIVTTFRPRQRFWRWKNHQQLLQATVRANATADLWAITLEDLATCETTTKEVEGLGDAHTLASRYVKG